LEVADTVSSQFSLLLLISGDLDAKLALLQGANETMQGPPVSVYFVWKD
jgi:hypothetical protein